MDSCEGKFVIVYVVRHENPVGKLAFVCGYGEDRSFAVRGYGARILFAERWSG